MGNISFSSLTILVLEVKTSICITVKEMLLLYLVSSFWHFFVAIVRCISMTKSMKVLWIYAVKFKELLARNRCDLKFKWLQRDRDHLAKLVKWLSCILSTYLYVALTAWIYVTYVFRVNLHLLVASLKRNSVHEIIT